VHLHVLSRWLPGLLQLPHAANPAGQVFLQSDVYNAVVAMRDEFEQYAGDILQLSPLHSPATTFQWTPEQEAAAAAASEQPSDVARRQQQQQQHGDEAATSSSSSSSEGDGSSDSSQENSSSADDEGYEEVHSSQLHSEEEQFVSSWAAGGWLVDNPLGVPTEREHYVQAQGGKVLRVLLVKQ
jgi:tRNA (guanine-N7-)-methyltransferase